jgi:hypothetical protein
MNNLPGVTATENYPSYTQHSILDSVIDTVDYNSENFNDYERFIPDNVSKVTKDNSSIINNTNISTVELYYASSRDFLNVMESKQTTPNNHYFNAYYDYIQLDETADVDSNNRHHLTTQPFRLMRGVVNQHVMDILQSDKFITSTLTKPLLFNTKFSQSGETLRDKELLPETL